MNLFYIVDVFAREKYKGNQLAVVIPDKELTGAQMQDIAREFNFSETTFILSRQKRPGGFDVRIFTPEEEVPFAGHPSLGTSYIIRRELLKAQEDQILLNLKIGQIPVAYLPEEGIYRMEQNAPEFGKTYSHAEAARWVGLAPDDLDFNFPVQEVSTGLPFIIIPVKTLEAIRRADPVKEAYGAYDKPLPCFELFCPETCDPSNRIHIRMFAPQYGIPEDPATGSAAGCLASWLVKHSYFRSPQIRFTAEQGGEIKRPSIIYMEARETGGSIEVFIGGKVFPVGEGRLL